VVDNFTTGISSGRREYNCNEQNDKISEQFSCGEDASIENIVAMVKFQFLRMFSRYTDTSVFELRNISWIDTVSNNQHLHHVGQPPILGVARASTPQDFEANAQFQDSDGDELLFIRPIGIYNVIPGSSDEDVKM
jgi:hypothetical protein